MWFIGVVVDDPIPTFTVVGPFRTRERAEDRADHWFGMLKWFVWRIE